MTRCLKPLTVAAVLISVPYCAARGQQTLYQPVTAAPLQSYQVVPSAMTLPAFPALSLPKCLTPTPTVPAAAFVAASEQSAFQPAAVSPIQYQIVPAAAPTLAMPKRLTKPATTAAWVGVTAAPRQIVWGPTPIGTSIAWLGQRMVALGQRHVITVQHTRFLPFPQPAVQQTAAYYLAVPTAAQPAIVPSAQQALQPMAVPSAQQVFQQQAAPQTPLPPPAATGEDVPPPNPAHERKPFVLPEPGTRTGQNPD